MTAPDPVLVDPGEMEQTERNSRGIERLPTSLAEAIEALGEDEVLMEAMGDVLSREYLLIKSADWENSKDQDAESELHQYIHRY
jgi:glutamine synthetase